MFIRHSLPVFSVTGYIELTTTVEVDFTTTDSEVIYSTTSHQPDVVTYANTTSTAENSTGDPVPSTNMHNLIHVTIFRSLHTTKLQKMRLPSMLPYRH